jgi:hypothetical protein
MLTYLEKLNQEGLNGREFRVNGLNKKCLTILVRILLLRRDDTMIMYRWKWAANGPFVHPPDDT